MNDDITLVILAAGMGSRYGGMKQIEPIGPSGEIIADYSVYDAMRAGFKRVVFVIKEEMAEDFNAVFRNRISRHIQTDIAFQRLSDIPEGFSFPTRTKPWGTGHAALCAEKAVTGNFAVINADDFYGESAFRLLYNFLSKTPETTEISNYCMVGYRLSDTLSESGSVARGRCEIGENGILRGLTEITRIIQNEQGVFYYDDRELLTPISPDTVVSMNCFGFTQSFFPVARECLTGLLTKLQGQPEETVNKTELYLPDVVMTAMGQNLANVTVMTGSDKWHGFTYKEDREGVESAVRRLVRKGRYPESLWG